MRGVVAAVLSFAALLVQGQERISDVIYLKQGGCAFTMDVFKPKTPNHKAVVWMVSGGWFSNHNNIDPMLAKAFTDRGFTFFEVVHGSQPKYTIPEIVPMVRRAIRFVRFNASNYDVDPKEIGVSGGSAGGHLSLEIGGLGDDGDPNAKDPVDKVSSRVQAIVAFFPPTDFENWGRDNFTPLDAPQMSIFLPAFGVTAQTPKDVRQKIAHDTSPIILVKADFPPTLLVHGDADTLVPVQQSQKLDALFEALHVTHKLIVVHGTGHGGDTFVKGLPDAINWFDSNLKAKS
ncbi:MAG TPA: alpha/beta hydrolase [Fimbriimonas sp.]|nr:alpha/beta hydrolase [Fimbriimonas sp.]